MLKALENADQFRGATPQEYRGWLRRILANAVYDEGKKEGLIGDDPAHKVSLEEQLEESGLRLDALLALDSSPPSTKAIDREELVRLEKALEQLPEKQRIALELHKLQGYSVAETSRRMGLTKQAVGGLLVRAMKTLRKLLENA
jgi:RNA polymerase sigma-70 factor (subfamily 1)